MCGVRAAPLAHAGSASLCRQVSSVAAFEKQCSNMAPTNLRRVLVIGPPPAETTNGLAMSISQTSSGGVLALRIAHEGFNSRRRTSGRCTSHADGRHAQQRFWTWTRRGAPWGGRCHWGRGCSYRNLHYTRTYDITTIRRYEYFILGGYSVVFVVFLVFATTMICVLLLRLLLPRAYHTHTTVFDCDKIGERAGAVSHKGCTRQALYGEAGTKNAEFCSQQRPSEMAKLFRRRCTHRRVA